MSAKSLCSVWTLVGLLAGLFVLTLFTPKAWESMRKQPLPRMKGRRVVELATVSPPSHKIQLTKQAQPERPAKPKGPAISLEPSHLDDTPLAATTETPSVAVPQLPALAQEPEPAAQPPAMPSELPAELETTTRPASPPVIVSINDDLDQRPPPAWPRPTALLAQLDELTSDNRTADWARRAGQAVEAVSELDSHHDGRTPQFFDHLRKVAGEAAHLAHQLEPLGTRIKLKRAEYALTRRIEVWEQVYAVATNSKTTYPAVVAPRRLADSLAKIEAGMKGRSGAAEWRGYLLLDQAWNLARSRSWSEQEQRELARAILSRLESPALNETQQAYFRKPEFSALAAELRLYAHEQVDVVKLLSDLEDYETDRRREPAEKVAAAYQTLRWSREEETVALGERIDTHYRNANLRFAVSGQLINKLLPELKPTAEDVSETILGADVRGRSETATRLWVRLIPDRLRIRLGLEASGVVASETSASKGPATFHQDGLSRYSARKQVVIDRRGMKVWKSEAEADSETFTRSLETNFDGLPIFGPLVRSIAQQKQFEMMGQAKLEMDGHVAGKASERLDYEVHKKLQEAEREFQAKILDPLTMLKLQPTAMGMETTAERLIVRYRVAGDYQLAAHTPRPQAPGDSWLSVQIHQTAINNAIEQLNFDDRQTNLRDLLKDVAQALGQPAPKLPEDFPDDVTLKFAERDAVRVQCDAGQVLLVIRLAELKAGRANRWRNFEVRAPLMPQAAGLDAQLIRDGTIELSGERLGLRDQVALRAIFSRAISKNKAINVVPEKFRHDPRLQDLTVQQFIIDDGWVSLALSPRRPPLPPHANSRPAAKSRKAAATARLGG